MGVTHVIQPSNPTGKHIPSIVWKISAERVLFRHKSVGIIQFNWEKQLQTGVTNNLVDKMGGAETQGGRGERNGSQMKGLGP